AEAEEVHALSGGNPFFVSEVGRVVAERPAGAAASLVTASLRDIDRASSTNRIVSSLPIRTSNEAAPRSG
ncbi:MAG: hypothetical protein M3082_15695, partial [Candidatus Dormibacteraeota bacterium]|nr:hypothetical protein [Candidatus Dormibacteraeota bacterium]